MEDYNVIDCAFGERTIINHNDDYETEEYTYKEFRKEMIQLKKNSDHSEFNKDGGIEIFCDYRDYLDQKDFVKIFRHKDGPRAGLDEVLDGMVESYQEYEEEEFEEIVFKYLSKNGQDFFEQNKDFALELMRDEFYYFVPEAIYDREVLVNILLDTKNSGSDFTKDGILGYYGKGLIEPESSMLFLARSQDSEGLLRATVDQLKERPTAEVITGNQFIDTAIAELENCTSLANTVTFCVKMNLTQVIELYEYVNDPNNAERTIRVSHDARCGLFNPWDGAGSLMEINLARDVYIPCKFVHTSNPDGYYRWDVGEVYGVDSTFWSGSCEIAEPPLSDEDVCIFVEDGLVTAAFAKDGLKVKVVSYDRDMDSAENLDRLFSDCNKRLSQVNPEIVHP